MYLESTLTQKGQKTIVLQAYTPIENEFKIAFAKEGQQVSVLSPRRYGRIECRV